MASPGLRTLKLSDEPMGLIIPATGFNLVNSVYPTGICYSAVDMVSSMPSSFLNKIS